VWGPLVRHGRLPLRRERVPTADSDFVDLDWAGGPAEAPLVVVLHGLEGSAQSHYVIGLLREVIAVGWRGVALNFRSCSGELNRLPRFYHSGDTADLDAIVNLLVAREAGVRLGAVGVSLGGNILLKWLGECGTGVPKQFVAAVGISVPFDLAACAQVLDHGLRRALYTENFMRTLRRKVRDKARRFPGFVDIAAASRARTFAAYAARSRHRCTASPTSTTTGRGRAVVPISRGSAGRRSSSTPSTTRSSRPARCRTPARCRATW